MATLIPTLGSARFNARGELRLTERLKDCLEAYAVAPRRGRSASALFYIREIRILTRSAYHPYHSLHHSYFKNKEYGKSQ